MDNQKKKINRDDIHIEKWKEDLQKDETWIKELEELNFTNIKWFKDLISELLNTQQQ